MRALVAIYALLFASLSQAGDWVCPTPNDDYCDSYHAEFIEKQADKRMNEVYRHLLSDYATKDGRQPTVNAQRAWLKYADAHCAAILSKFPGGAPGTASLLEYSCRTELINKRIVELESYCESCSGSNL